MCNLLLLRKHRQSQNSRLNYCTQSLHHILLQLAMAKPPSAIMTRSNKMPAGQKYTTTGSMVDDKKTSIVASQEVGSSFTFRTLEALIAHYNKLQMLSSPILEDKDYDRCGGLAKCFPEVGVRCSSVRPISVAYADQSQMGAVRVARHDEFHGGIAPVNNYLGFDALPPEVRGLPRLYHYGFLHAYCHRFLDPSGDCSVLARQRPQVFLARSAGGS